MTKYTKTDITRQELGNSVAMPASMLQQEMRQLRLHFLNGSFFHRYAQSDIHAGHHAPHTGIAKICLHGRLHESRNGTRAHRSKPVSPCLYWLRGQDLNLRPSGYEPDELPDCSTPRQRTAIIDGIAAVRNAIAGNRYNARLPRSAARVVPDAPQARTIFKLRSPNPYRARVSSPPSRSQFKELS